ELNVVHPDGHTQRLGIEPVRVTEESEIVDARFSFTPPTPGEYRLILRAVPQEDEQISDNNELGAFLTVLDGGLRVLYLEGNPGWQEQKFIRRSIDGSPDLDLDFAWVDIRGRSQWPLDLQSVFARQRYDVMILGDVHGDALGKEQARWLSDRIDQGLGLMLLGGWHVYGAGGYAGLAGLADAIPVRMSAFERRDATSPPDAKQRTYLELQAHPTRPHFITDLSGVGDADWTLLPTLRGACRIRGTSTGQVLLEGLERGVPRGDGPIPLLIAADYGRGRVLASAMDSTFRWYRHGFEDVHRRFWRQSILWLARKDSAKSGSVWLELAERRFPSGASVGFEAGARDEHGQPKADVELTATATWEGSGKSGDTVDGTEAKPGPAVPVSLNRTEPNWVGATEVLRRPGIYRIDLRGTLDGKEYGIASARWIVTQQDLELTDPVANPRELALLASATEAAGGRAIAAEQLPALFQEIGARRAQHRITHEERWQLGDTLLDSWLFFLTLVSLLSTEWYLR
ncbi:MAG TPA: hypothetical protein VIY86_11290, partial [Pirellulaceae bacterium]